MVYNNISLIFQIDVVNNNNTAGSIQSILVAFNDYAMVFKVGCVIGEQQHFFTIEIYGVPHYFSLLVD